MSYFVNTLCHFFLNGPSHVAISQEWLFEVDKLKEKTIVF